MLRKLIVTLIAAVMLTCSAYAETTVTVTDITPQEESVTALPETLPLSVETRTEAGVELLVKTFELPPEADPATLMEEAPERGGVAYMFREMTQQDMEPVTVSKPVSQSVSINAPSDRQEDILPLLKKYLPYDSDGYTGKLYLDESAIAAAVESTTGYNYEVSPASTPALPGTTHICYPKRWKKAASHTG